jgi:hypothetical protein
MGFNMSELKFEKVSKRNLEVTVTHLLFSLVMLMSVVGV